MGGAIRIIFKRQRRDAFARREFENSLVWRYTRKDKVACPVYRPVATLRAVGE